MRIVKRLALDVGRFAAVVAATFFTWIGFWFLFNDLIHWGPISSTFLATAFAVLNGCTTAYNVSPLDTQE